MSELIKDRVLRQRREEQRAQTERDVDKIRQYDEEIHKFAEGVIDNADFGYCMIVWRRPPAGSKVITCGMTFNHQREKPMEVYNACASALNLLGANIRAVPVKKN